MNELASTDPEVIADIERSIADGVLSRAFDMAPSIDVREGLSVADFDAEYRAAGQPVVIRGMAADWPAVRDWSFTGLAARCGDVEVTVDSYSRAKAQPMRFADFVVLMERPDRGASEPLYLQEWLYRAISPELADDLPDLPIAAYDFRRELYGESIAANHQLWIGEAGATTRIHQDSYFIDVMHVQIRGIKRWSVFGPEASLTRDAAGRLDFETLAADPAARPLRADIAPGDVIFLPALWWHHVRLLSDSIGLGRKALDPVNLREHVWLRLNELMALALNHEEIRRTHPDMYGGVVARNRAWARLLDLDLSNLRPEVPLVRGRR